MLKPVAPNCFKFLGASALPRRRTLATPLQPAPASPGTTPPHGLAQTSASALPRRWTLAMPLQPATPADSVRAQQTFNPPADSVTLDTPTSLSIKRVSTATRSRVTSDPLAVYVTIPRAHTRMFSRRANSARRLARKLSSAAPPQRGSSTEASP
ncbi:unnamed protein product [Arctogadus glacialis]